MPQITRKFSFDAGHRVLRHESKCKHLHGHTYLAEVTIYAKELDDLGRVIDFGEVKTIVGGWIDANWDHNILLNSQDPLAYLWTDAKTPAQSVLDIFGCKPPYLMGCNPTAENMAEELYVRVARLLPVGLDVIQVRMHETPYCYADYIPEDRR